MDCNIVHTFLALQYVRRYPAIGAFQSIVYYNPPSTQPIRRPIYYHYGNPSLIFIISFEIPIYIYTLIHTQHYSTCDATPPQGHLGEQFTQSPSQPIKRPIHYYYGNPSLVSSISTEILLRFQCFKYSTFLRFSAPICALSYNTVRRTPKKTRSSSSLIFGNSLSR